MVAAQQRISQPQKQVSEPRGWSRMCPSNLLNVWHNYPKSKFNLHSFDKLRHIFVVEKQDSEKPMELLAWDQHCKHDTEINEETMAGKLTEKKGRN